jgi:hypothetical protein
MLHDVVIHILNEQPLLADLVSEPKPSDVVLICRNLRTLNGKKPVFVDRPDSTFVLPLAGIRFLEIHQTSVEAHESETAAEAAAQAAEEARVIAAAAEVEFAGSALARLDWMNGDEAELEYSASESGPPIEGQAGDVDPDGLDGDLLRRIREA